MEPPGPQPSRRPELVLGILAVLLAIAGAVIPFTGIGASNASATMNCALTSTMDESTVHATFTATLSAQGETVHLTGTATTDRATKSGTADVSIQAAGHHFTVSVVVSAGEVYLEVPQVTKVAPGKSWLSFPEPRSGASGGAGGAAGAGGAGANGTGSTGLSPGALGQMADLGTFLQVLRQAGATVQTLGASTLGGTPVDGYGVQMDGAAVEAAIARAGLPQAAAQALSAFTVSTLHFTVYTSNGLLRGVDVDATATVAGVSISGNGTLRLTGYGQPVTVQPPPVTSTVTIEQFLKSAHPGLTGISGLGGLGGFTAFLPAA